LKRQKEQQRKAKAEDKRARRARRRESANEELSPEAVTPPEKIEGAPEA
jgi:hypothetical protein